MPISVSDDARQRLRDAQRAEAAALSVVTAATAARERLEPRITAADQRVDEAVAELVAVSGVDRTAQLLGEPVSAVRGSAAAGSAAATAGDPHSRHRLWRGRCSRFKPAEGRSGPWTSRRLAMLGGSTAFDRSTRASGSA